MILIAGPTAVGKSEIALLLAEQIGGEIISVDSMQVYRGMDIGTAKSSAIERERVPHHLIDIRAITEPFDAAQFVRHAEGAAQQILGRGNIPIFCGGTGLYFKAYLEGLGGAPRGSPELRKVLEETPQKELLAELERRDPETFKQIDRRNPRRVIRALEVVRLTGKPFSEQRAPWNEAGAVRQKGLFVGLARDAEDLRERINSRVEQMFQRGLVAETERLLNHGLQRNKVAMQALGYRQVIDYLAERSDLTETVELVKLRTRQFAKRQMTWFRRQLALQWIDLSRGEQAAAIVDRIGAILGE
jgi:tRNA dimethylallyltransferase